MTYNNTTPTSADFRTTKKLYARLNVNRTTQKHLLVSVDELEVPKWQRQVVWNEDENLLPGSIVALKLRGFPECNILVHTRKRSLKWSFILLSHEL